MTETIKVDTKAEAEVKLTDRPEHAAKFLHNNGLLFEINQQILHPLGYSLDVIQTEKKFSFMGLDKAGKPLLIETSHTLGSLYEKFGVFKLQIERAKLSDKVMESVKKEFDKVLSDLTKLEPMCGAKFKVWKFTFWISRENDGHDANNGLTFKSSLSVPDAGKQLLFEPNVFVASQKRFDEYMQKEGNLKCEIRERELGFTVQTGIEFLEEEKEVVEGDLI